MLSILMLIVIGLGLMVHFLTPRQAGAHFGRVVLGVLFLPVLWGIARGLWQGLGVLVQAACLVIIVPVVLFVVIRLVFGRAVYSEMMGHLVYDVVRWLGRGVISLLALVARLIGATVGFITAAVRDR